MTKRIILSIGIALFILFILGCGNNRFPKTGDLYFKALYGGKPSTCGLTTSGWMVKSIWKMRPDWAKSGNELGASEYCKPLQLNNHYLETVNGERQP